MARIFDILNRGISGSSPTELVSVVLPFHTGEFADAEWTALRHCARVLARYPRWLVLPDTAELDPRAHEFVTGVKRLPDVYFRDFAAHQRMCLSEEFYDLFADSEFILMHHLDAVVFRDELEDWCLRDYCYVGAPFMDEASARWAAQRCSLPRRIFARLGLHTKIRVGNGGLSLRKISSMRTALRLLGPVVRRFDGNEDVFWSFAATSYLPWMRIPPVTLARRFAWEIEPSTLMRICGTLPFGCHAWQRVAPEFWRPILKQQGYWENFDEPAAKFSLPAA